MVLVVFTSGFSCLAGLCGAPLVVDLFAISGQLMVYSWCLGDWSLCDCAQFALHIVVWDGGLRHRGHTEGLERGRQEPMDRPRGTEVVMQQPWDTSGD